jgi:hypothetical protein
VPRLGREERRQRDGLILQLFVAGNSHRSIAAHARVRLSHRAVGRIIERELATGGRRGVLAVEARTVFVMRTEALLRTHMPKALDGDVAAAELCRKVLDQQARVYGLNANVASE